MMNDDLKLQAYSYHLPEQNIAQYPAEKRDHSRLLVLNRTTGEIEHLQFNQIIRLFRPGDLLVVNDTKVFPARLSGRKESGGKAEVFLLNYPSPVVNESDPSETFSFQCEALIKSSRPPKAKARIVFDDHSGCTLIENCGRGKWRIELKTSSKIGLDSLLQKTGDVPLPPYIKRPDGTSKDDISRYQTVYANQPGAVAAPTAGLHFTDKLLQTLQAKEVGIASITLHVGYGTFAPVQEKEILNHNIHQELIEITGQTADIINQTKSKGGNIWAVGTTTVRALEFSADDDGRVRPVRDWCDLYITPGFNFRVIDNLITNFHLPQSSLLFLVSALCGRHRLLDCYQKAIEHNYRFYSYGDAMAIIGKSGSY